MLTVFTVGLSWARFWRAFGISGGGVEHHNPIPSSVRHCLTASYVPESVSCVWSRKIRQGTAPTGCGCSISLQIWRVATCLLSKQLRVVDSECSSSLRDGRGSSKPICYERLHDVTFEISKNHYMITTKC